MLVMRINSQKKAEKIIHSNRGKRRMHWQRYYYTDHEGGLCAEYLIFYYPIGRKATA